MDDAAKEPSLNQLAILRLTHDDLTRVEAKMREVTQDAFGPLGDAFSELLDSGGKRLRPALALLSYRIFAGPANRAALALGTAVEMLHTATLVHDDLIDEAILRRGRSTLNAVWSKGATVLAGDYLFARAAGAAAEAENIQVMKLFAETLREICDGELRQLFSSRQWEQPKDAYYRRIFAKTASLFASATRAGAILGGAPPEMEAALHEYGYHLGMAFQIVDDILDFSGDERVLGKPVGGDLRQGIVTLPFFYFMAGQPDPAALREQLNDSRDGALVAIVAQIRDSGAIAQAQSEADRFAAQAKADCERLPAGVCRDALGDLADFVVARRA
jgi:geranylgeranyl pyrophosphate synthase